MTREIAIRRLQHIIGYFNYRVGEDVEALNMAIEALKVIKPEKEDIGFEGDEIFLLSIEEYEKYKDKIPAIYGWWWLRSPGAYSNYVALVYSGGSVNYSGNYVWEAAAVRPALKLRGEYDVGARIVLNDFPWIVIDKSLAIAEVPIGQAVFDTDDTDDHCYRTSYIRAYLKKWLEDRSETSIVKEQKEDKWSIPNVYPPYSIILEGGKPKKGKWIMGNGTGTTCSRCNYKLETTGLLMYCPHCGAQMEIG